MNQGLIFLAGNLRVRCGGGLPSLARMIAPASQRCAPSVAGETDRTAPAA